MCLLNCLLGGVSIQISIIDNTLETFINVSYKNHASVSRKSGKIKTLYVVSSQPKTSLVKPKKSK